MRKNFKKLFVSTLAAVMVLASTSLAFAAWPSFQNTNANNGVISTAPLTSNQNELTEGGDYLRTKTLNQAGGGWSGVDNTPVIKDGYAYVLYNGRGTASSGGTYQGGRLAKIDLKTGADIWNVQTTTTNSFQLSTPALDGDTLYFLSQGAAPVWTDAAAAVDISAGSAYTVTKNVVLAGVASDRIYVDAMLNAASASQNVKLSVSVRTPGGTTYNLNVDNDSTTESGGTTTLALGTTNTYLNKNYSEAFGTAGTYTITFKYTNADASKAAKVDINECQLYENSLQLKKVNDITAADPTVSSVSSLNIGGQCNTPITISGDYLYFGRWTSESGAGTYYQVNKNTGAVQTYETSRGYYWAGATVYDGKVYFGCDDGNLHYRSVTNFAGEGGVVEASGTAGTIRSSICQYNNSGTTELYFTSKNGYLWKYVPSTGAISSMSILKSDQSGTTASTSTPTISNKGFIYVGYYGNSNSGVNAIHKNNFGNTASWRKIVAKTGSANAANVQASVLVYTSLNTDYIYFTTNVSAGAGYCYKVPAGSSTETTAATRMWETPSGTGTFTLQGMASDGGYLVFGNDANKLYIVKKGASY